VNIDGNSRVIVHLAYPAKHLRTPSYFNPLLVRQGRNAVLVPWQVHPDNLEDVWQALRLSESLAGVIVTIPHKTAVATLCDQLEGSAAFMQVANVARRTPDGRFIGNMFDGAGYLKGLEKEGHKVTGKSVLLIGAGGAATGIAYALVEAGVAQLTIANRTRSKAEDLAEQLNNVFRTTIVRVGDPVGGDHDVVINGTSIGMQINDPLPIDPLTVRPEALVGEVIMQPDETALLKACAARGCPTHKGKHMITGQTELLADFLLGEA